MTPVILLTRPAPDAAPLAEALRERLGDVPILLSPLLEIVPMGPLPDAQGAAGLIFTSRNGVRAWVAQGGARLPSYCVGPGTAALARAAGFAAIAAEGDGAALARRIAADRPAGRWLHLHGRHLRVDLSEALRPAGITVEGHAIYDQRALPLTDAASAAFAGTAPVILPVFSPRSGKLLTRGENPAAPVYIVAMSGAVAEAVAGWTGAKCTIAGQPDLRSMLETVVESYRRAARVEGGDAAK